jgi:hypothetical protein
MIRMASALFVAAALARTQSHTMTHGFHRVEIVLERLDKDTWRTVDPGLVLDSGDRVRFKVRTNFEGYLYVTNQGTGGTYDQLFPRQDTGQNNRILASREYQVPATTGAFRVAGPPGHDIVYWLLTPGRVTDGMSANPLPTVKSATPKPNLMPRCDDTILRARGECVDSSAGPKLVPRGIQIPLDPTAPGTDSKQRDLLFMRQKNTAVISSPELLTGPIVYEFDLAHR